MDQEARRWPDQQPPAPQVERVMQPELLADDCLLNFDMQEHPAADFQAVLPMAATATLGQNADAEPDHEVQLSLAQEFEALWV